MPTATFKVKAHPDDHLLQRIVVVCHRRRVDILALSYAPGEITLTVAAPDLGRVGAWLRNLVDVIDVARADARPGAVDDYREAFARNSERSFSVASVSSTSPSGSVFGSPWTTTP